VLCRVVAQMDVHSGVWLAGFCLEAAPSLLCACILFNILG
jgi:hypothetical protein